MTPNRLILVALLALTGAGLSGLLLLEHHGVAFAGVAVDGICGAEPGSGCDAVAKSRYSSVGDVSLAAAGLFFYASMLALLALALVTSETARKAASSWLVLAFSTALVVDFVLLGVQAFAIRSYCTFCIATYVLNLASFALLFPAFSEVSNMTVNLFRGEGRRTFIVWTCASLVLLIFVGAVEQGLSAASEAPQIGLLGAPVSMTGASRDSQIGLDEALARIRELEETMDDPAKYEQYQVAKALAQFEKEPVNELSLEDVPFKGPEDAAIKVVEFSDFLCPFCRSLAAAFSNYMLNSKGRVAIYFKNYPLDIDCNPGLSRTVHEGACELARGAICAEAQDKFWPYHDMIFVAPPKNATHDDVARIGAAAGLDENTLRGCLTEDSTRDKLADQINEAKRLEIRATPTVFVNGKRLEKTSGFMHAIDFETKRLGLE
jgi:protein-disulfide isomerase/uncharacterized membrane protein